MPLSLGTSRLNVKCAETEMSGACEAGEMTHSFSGFHSFTVQLTTTSKKKSLGKFYWVHRTVTFFMKYLLTFLNSSEQKLSIIARRRRRIRDFSER
jgi:hypothetical protein